MVDSIPAHDDATSPPGHGRDTNVRSSSRLVADGFRLVGSAPGAIATVWIAGFVSLCVLLTASLWVRALWLQVVAVPPWTWTAARWTSIWAARSTGVGLVPLALLLAVTLAEGARAVALTQLSAVRRDGLQAESSRSPLTSALSLSGRWIPSALTGWLVRIVFFGALGIPFLWTIPVIDQHPGWTAAALLAALTLASTVGPVVATTIRLARVRALTTRESIGEAYAHAWDEAVTRPILCGSLDGGLTGLRLGALFSVLAGGFVWSSRATDPHVQVALVLLAVALGTFVSSLLLVLRLGVETVWATESLMPTANPLPSIRTDRLPIDVEARRTTAGEEIASTAVEPAESPESPDSKVVQSTVLEGIPVDDGAVSDEIPVGHETQDSFVVDAEIVSPSAESPTEATDHGRDADAVDPTR